MRKILNSNISIKNDVEIEKYSTFLQKNRNLRIDIKSLLSEQKESQKRIEELKKSINIFGINTRLSQTSEIGKVIERQRASTCANPTKRELIKFRDYLLEQNEKYLFQLKLKLA